MCEDDKVLVESRRERQYQSRITRINMPEWKNVTPILRYMSATHTAPKINYSGTAD